MSTYLQDKRDEEGFTLIELLVVVIIIGILAAIAIPVFLNQRENAWVRAAESDVRNAAIEVESYMNNEGSYPADRTAFDGMTNLNSSDGVHLFYALDEAGTYTISACHVNLVDDCDDTWDGSDATAVYLSGAGGLQRD